MDVLRELPICPSGHSEKIPCSPKSILAGRIQSILTGPTQKTTDMNMVTGEEWNENKIQSQYQATEVAPGV